jgi:hypothetical protein
MGDRVSISFLMGDDESIVLFHHWGGTGFPEEAKEYAEELVKEFNGNGSDPLGRLEANTVMVDFVRWYTAREYGKERVTSSLYFGKDNGDGDNSDNGHYIIEFIKKDDKQGCEVVMHGGR